MQKKNITILLFILILGIFFLLRIWNLKELFHFTYDEEIIAFVGKRMFVNAHIPLIGGVTPMHVHLAPYFYWLSGIFLFISNLNPQGWGVAAAVLSIITLFLLFKTGELFFNRKTGLIATIIYGISFYQNIFDRHYWGLVFNGLISLLVLYSLHKIISGNHKFILLLSGILAYGFHTDPSTLILLVLSLIVFYFYKPDISVRLKAFALVIFLASFIPLIIFDLRHNFSNSKGVIQYLSEIKERKPRAIKQNIWDTFLFIPSTLSRALYVFGDKDLAVQYSYCPQHATERIKKVPLIFSGIVALGLIFVFIKLKHKQEVESGIKILKTLFISSVLGVIIYGNIFNGDLFDHYLSPLFPGFYLILAYLLTKLLAKKPLLYLMLLSLFIVSNLSLLVNAQHRFGYADKISAVSWAISQTSNQDFSLDVISSCFRYNGYRYLFYLLGKEPSKSYVDANFTHLYDYPPAFNHPSLLVVITNPDIEETEQYYEEYNKFLSKTINMKTFGNIEVLIVDNSNLEFVGKF